MGVEEEYIHITYIIHVHSFEHTLIDESEMNGQKGQGPIIKGTKSFKSI